MLQIIPILAMHTCNPIEMNLVSQVTDMPSANYGLKKLIRLGF